jgi:hypothetical protein
MRIADFGKGVLGNSYGSLKMPPVFALALGMLGAAALVRWCYKEVHRVNSDLNGVRAKAAVEPVDRDALPQLKRDPKTGEYRPG